jgi:hypothetical protein
MRSRTGISVISAALLTTVSKNCERVQGYRERAGAIAPWHGACNALGVDKNTFEVSRHDTIST